MALPENGVDVGSMFPYVVENGNDTAHSTLRTHVLPCSPAPSEGQPAAQPNQQPLEQPDSKQSSGSGKMLGFVCSLVYDA